MTDIEAARTKWVSERDDYCKFAEVVRIRLHDAMRPCGFWFEVTSRAKETDSLVKKLLEKSNHTYDSLPDKVGARIIVKYRAEVEPAIRAAQGALVCGNVDDKLKAQGVDKVGYLSVHVDKACLKPDDPVIGQYSAARFWLELQVRTLAQHLWSEMSHDTIYKNQESISALPDDVKRRVNLMAGQIEVADREFDRLNGELPADPAIQLLKLLERFYYKHTTRRPNIDLSLQLLRLILPTYKGSPAEIKSRLAAFLESKAAVLQHVFTEAAMTPPQSALLFQPEALAIYERLENAPIEIKKAWNKEYPEKELDDIATQFGLSID
jgi:putative GTP pyrophosphokinase